MTPSRGAPGGGDGGVPKHAGAAPGAGPAAAVPAPRPARTRRVLLVGIGAAAAAAGIGGNWWQTQRREAAHAQARELWALRFARPEGGELALADFRGRPLLINFWATWCPPCVRELPAFDRFASAQRGRVQVVGLAIDREQPVRDFLARQPVSFPIGLAGSEGAELSRRLGNTGGGLPFTVLLDSDGIVQQTKMGETHLADLEAWTRKL
ncbi:MAG TPA: TlpA disulfide reductase family protein [Rubrivivax sp.]|nr:TlpA disulfide reductase family protein [Rubrivivax sp.]HRZ60007.1 TlpA disulfide reductase family protein [Rubrivivax sp.]